MKKVKYRKNQIIHGWRVVQVKKIVSPPATCLGLEHIKTGAKYFHVANDSRDNTFCVAFKTIPNDNTGVAHILEHTALTGSKKYPVRDPFFSMLKRSLQTFMNAFTSEDWTAYPFSTSNKKDFYNLLSVYLDSAFFPRLDRLDFLQEGHRLELVGNQLVSKGVVYNEMKGALSSPECLMTEYTKEALFPTTSYKFNSGGNPEAIPSLSHQMLVDFHKKHYQPNNSYFYSYGNLLIDGHLKFINKEVLNKFKSSGININIKKEPRWASPRRAIYYYPLDTKPAPAAKTQVAMVWLLGDQEKQKYPLVWELISDILLGNPAAPLRQVLISSGLGSGLSDNAGLNSEQRNLVFSCGLKDIKKEDIASVKKLIIKTLKEICRTEIDKKVIVATLAKLEFNKREITNMPYPAGLKLWMELIGPWLYGADPGWATDADTQFKKLKSLLKQPRYLELMIEKKLLKNSHHVLISLEPSSDLLKKQATDELVRLSKQKEKLSQAAKEQIKADTADLIKWQQTNGDISCLPGLELSDINKRTTSLKPKYKNNNYSYYDKATVGLLYMYLAFPVSGLKPDQLLLLPFLSYILPKLGTKSTDYATWLRLVEINTGGLSATPLVQSNQQSLQAAPYWIINTKCLASKQKQMFSLVKQLISDTNFDQKELIIGYLKEYIAQIEASIIESGHHFALSSSARGLTRVKEMNEWWYGLSQLHFARKLLKNFLALRSEFGFELKNLSDHIIGSGPVKLAIVGDSENSTKVKSLSADLLGSLPKKTRRAKKPGLFSQAKINEAWSTTTAVSFVACSLPVVRIGHPDSATLTVAGKIMSRTFLNNEIREKGGAYGGFARYYASEGIFQFGSYRDPHVINTLSAFSNASKSLQDGKFEEEEVKEGIIQSIADIDKPDTPAEQGERAFYRALFELSDRQRQQFRTRLLRVKKEQVIAVAKKYLNAPVSNGSVAVITNASKIKSVNKRLSKKKFKINKI
ncbi:insulinase family protein [Candidatus Parcubacteria bacterium]|nr:insulinase family protein [Candidatus Parcubacteria bacterium]